MNTYDMLLGSEYSVIYKIRNYEPDTMHQVSVLSCESYYRIPNLCLPTSNVDKANNRRAGSCHSKPDMQICHSASVDCDRTERS